MPMKSDRKTTSERSMDEDYDDGVSCSDDSEGQCSNDDGTASTVSSTNNEEKEITRLIRKESTGVYIWRYIFLAVLIVTTALLTTATYIFLSQQQSNDFVHAFGEIGEFLKDGLNNRMRSLFEPSRALSAVVTTFAEHSTWPNVTIPSFDMHASDLRSLTLVSALWFTTIVTQADRAGWEAYSNIHSPTPIYPSIYTINDSTTGTVEPMTGMGPFAPAWQMSPAPDKDATNFDVLSDPTMVNLTRIVEEMQSAAISGFMPHGPMMDLYDRNAGASPVSCFLQPIFERFKKAKNDEGEDGDKDVEGEGDRHDIGHHIVGYLHARLEWSVFLSNILCTGELVHVVLSNTCHQTSTWWIDAENATWQNEGDSHPTAYDPFKISFTFLPYGPSLGQEENEGSDETEEKEREKIPEGTCVYLIDLYPSAQLYAEYHTSFPVIYASIVGLVFFLMALSFFWYDRFVQKRNRKIIQNAVRSNVIVSSMFPAKIRDRMFAESQSKGGIHNAKSGLKTFLHDHLDDSDDHANKCSSKPIADLFPEVTIMFADIAGFTAWSSTREPSQVFTLLETLYHAFDCIAKQRRVFKVETVGDCYVAVTGLPDPRKDHAVAMAKFATDCLKQTRNLVRSLEVSLGPDTADLTIRVGLHSGPVTAGVLRGERSRFQLFGDTMNTASRMESTGVKGKIQVSQETADILTGAGKGHWLKERMEMVTAKGKGELKTFWLQVSEKVESSSTTDHELQRNQEFGGVANDTVKSDVSRLLSKKSHRLIDWNVELLSQSLKQIVAGRRANLATRARNEPEFTSSNCLHPIEEVQEIIALPEFDSVATKNQKGYSIVLDECVVEQLHEYVSSIAVMYRENSFHNFEHASHVTQSVTKLLSRIIAPSQLLDDFESRKREARELYSSLHDHTYGITSDPLTQFACCFSALIHDVDHTGAPNTQLVKENHPLAAQYENKSVAEQNSVDLAWGLLMESRYRDLRSTICATEAEQKRFRQLVVNMVMATDIMDKDLKALRNARWDKAFSGEHVDHDERDIRNRKATIVIEHLIQASDVAHTMQHWHIYRKWNERFFEECYHAYQCGRADKDPSQSWYEGEIGFFDFYIIPLAKKLKDCGVFGVSSDEYLIYAQNNRKEWEAKGREIVEGMMEKIKLQGEKSKLTLVDM